VDVLSRGYGRQSKLAGRVRPEGAAEDFGDEPLLITRATDLPVYVAGQRYQAGLLAECDGCADTSRAVHLLDDGFQHRQLHRDVDILLLDQRDWQEGMHLAGLLPAGNLREPLQAARRATVIAIPAGEPELEAALRAWGWQGPLWPLRRTMKFPSVDGPVAAFCGIARPEQFFDGLEAGGMNLAARFAFADHHSFTISDLKRLTTAARAAGATALLTTRKDRFRLGELAQALPESLPLMTIGLRIEIENEDAAIDWLMERVMSAR
jgi:tetraacyldisaccharide 4'-kinase